MEMGWQDDLYTARKIRSSSVKAKRIIRQSTREPNETERRFESNFLKPMLAAGIIVHYRFEPLRLRLGNGAWYKCEWVATDTSGRTSLYEVKGGRPRQREAGILTIKVAASLYPEYEFWLYRWQNGQWDEQRVLP